MELGGKKILITGADGFIGSHLTEELVAMGHDVRAFVFYNSFNTSGWLDYSPLEIKQNVEVISGDIRDAYGVKRAMKDIDVVFHLAALVAIPYSYIAPDMYIDTNIKGTHNILQAAREIGVQRVIQTSTSEVYGTAHFVPISELHPLQGQSPYSASKIGADQMALAYYCSFSVPVSIIRPFNTYGPRQSARAVIPSIIIQIAGGKKKIKLGSLAPTRDFNFVKDTVKGFIEVAKCDGALGEVVNIGSGFEVSVGETVRTIAKLMNGEIEIENDKNRIRPEKSEVQRLKADISKAVSLFGWKPDYVGRNGFERGLTETIEWFSNADNLKMYKSDRYNL